MPDYQAMKDKLQELSDRKWDPATIESRWKTIMAGGFHRRILDPKELVSNQQQILARIRRRAEEYNYFGRNCARSTAIAVMEEFGLGDLEIVKALSPFPGFGGTGWMCGGVTGGLTVLGLFAGSANIKDQDAVRATMTAARKFMARFEQEVGAVTCPKIHEEVVFGRYMDPGASPENMKAFEQAHGFEKCSLLPGIGARIATEIIIESLAPHA